MIKINHRLLFIILPLFLILSPRTLRTNSLCRSQVYFTSVLHIIGRLKIKNRTWVK